MGKKPFRDPLLESLSLELNNAAIRWRSRLLQLSPTLTDEQIADMAKAIVLQIPGLLAAQDEAYRAKVEAEKQPGGVASLAWRRMQKEGWVDPKAVDDPNREHFVLAAMLNGPRLNALKKAMDGGDWDVLTEALRRGLASLETEHGIGPKS